MSHLHIYFKIPDSYKRTLLGIRDKAFVERDIVDIGINAGW